MGRSKKKQRKTSNSRNKLKSSAHGPHFKPKSPISTPSASRQSVSTAPSNVRMELTRAAELHGTGQPEIAKEIYLNILEHNPNEPDALHLYGLLCFQEGDFEKAQRYIQKSLDQMPDSEIYLNSLSMVYRELGRLEEAQQISERLLAGSLDEWKLQLNMAKTLNKMARFQEALAAVQRARVLKPDDPEIEFEYGLILTRLFDNPNAVLAFRSVLDKQPDHLNAKQLLGCSLYHLEQYDEAIELFEDVLAQKPDFASVWSNCGACYQSLAQFEKAKACYQRAIDINPDFADAHNNYANVMLFMSDLDEAERVYKKSLELQPDYIEPMFSLAEIDLLRGKFDTGWEGYKLRLEKRVHDHRSFTHEEWDKKPTDKRILAYSEQGIGDVAMFASCLPELLRDCPNCILEVDLRMMKLFERSFPLKRVIARSKVVPENVSVSLPDAELQVSLGELPSIYRPTIESYTGEAYLIADEQLRKKWRQRFDALGEGLKVGISWRGGKNIEVQAKRSTRIEDWTQLLQTKGVQFINLQYGDCTDALQSVRENLGVEIHDWDDADPKADLDDFAAQLAELDLVISIDNATVHFAGALGVPCWVMLAKLPDWRWGLETDKSYWYRSLRLFRQDKPFDWTNTFQYVQQELQQVLGQPEQLQKLDVRIDSSNSTKETDSHNGPHPNVIQSSTLICGVITPVGPGHTAIYEENLHSLKSACETNSGPFAKIMPIRINDLEGNSGRSFARNFGVRQAEEMGCDWIFFLDADDVMCPNAFEHVGKYLHHYDAVWGQIYSFQDGSLEAEKRPDQLGKTDRFENILNSDPFLSLQMGHFVRTEVARKTPFHEGMDTGEDFHYYLRLWQNYRCIKIDEPFFANRRGLHSTGPRSATGRQWMQVVHALIDAYRQNFFNGVEFPDAITVDLANEAVAPPANLENAATLAIPKIIKQKAPLSAHVEEAQPPIPEHQPFVRRLDRPQSTISTPVPSSASKPELDDQQWREGWDPRVKLHELLSPYVNTSVIQIGSGDGKLCQAFDKETYLGVDANSQSVEEARRSFSNYQFETYGFNGQLPKADVCFAYTVLQQVDDYAIPLIIQQMCESSSVVLVAEILGREWRSKSRNPIFNRDKRDYEELFLQQQFQQIEYREYPYKHYPETNISFVLFARSN